MSTHVIDGYGKNQHVPNNIAGVQIMCAYDELVRIDKLRSGNNPKRHPERQIRLIAKLIQHHGWRVPVTVSMLSGTIVRGHARVEAARLLGMDAVPVDYQEYESREMEQADLVADNRVEQYTTWDMDALTDILRSCEAGDVELYGLDASDADALLKQIEIVADEKHELSGTFYGYTAPENMVPMNILGIGGYVERSLVEQVKAKLIEQGAREGTMENGEKISVIFTTWLRGRTA